MWLCRQRIIGCLHASGHASQLTPFARPLQPSNLPQQQPKGLDSAGSLRQPLLAEEGHLWDELTNGQAGSQHPSQHQAGLAGDKPAAEGASDGGLAAPSRQQARRQAGGPMQGQEAVDAQQEPEASNRVPEDSAAALQEQEGPARSSRQQAAFPSSSRSMPAGSADRPNPSPSRAASSGAQQQAQNRAQQGALPVSFPALSGRAGEPERPSGAQDQAMSEALLEAMSLTFSGGRGLEQVGETEK